jgi:hypothetical protein
LVERAAEENRKEKERLKAILIKLEFEKRELDKQKEMLKDLNLDDLLK